MPSFPSDVFDDDDAAWGHLAAKGFTHDRAVIKPPAAYKLGSDAEAEHAIDYLCYDWDWSYDPPTLPNSPTPE